MRTQLSWLQLHSPIFLAGTNLGEKLDPTKRQGLVLEYDEEKRHVYVTYQQQVTRVPETSVLSMVEGEPKIPKVVPAPEFDTTQRNPLNAQVDTPGGHVFEGPGAGQTGQEPPKKKGRGK